MTTVLAPNRFGRVVEASIGRFTAECFDRDCAPPLGELVAVEDGPLPIFAVVAAVVTQGIDPDRPVSARGGRDDDLERVLADHPHVSTLLQTRFEAAVVGHAAAGSARQYLPPAPALILARVRECSIAETHAIAGSFDYLRLLLDSGPHADEVIAASLRRASAAHQDSRAYLVRAGKALASLLARDPPRLQAILRKIQP